MQNRAIKIINEAYSEILSDEEKEYWLSTLDSMNEDQIERFIHIIARDSEKIKELDNKINIIQKKKDNLRKQFNGLI